MLVNAATSTDRRLTLHAMQSHPHQCGQCTHRMSVALGQVRYQWKRGSLSGRFNVMSTSFDESSEADDSDECHH